MNTDIVLKIIIISKKYNCLIDKNNKEWLIRRYDDKEIHQYKRESEGKEGEKRD